ncbi:twin-arginine translocation signal domain-containing protein [Paenibacillus daejeonensis]|uniref:twin-arginine translocation signal domain-containing protein n=1 Tax=Paenibacillus daejeonensis TaxID=135193 RepID=UPI0003723CCD|nr:twin-arginine translocation signal domain-containing protein [Paenibacillus daejeonensis]
MTKTQTTEQKTPTNLSRRTFLKAVAGGGILLASGGLWGSINRGVFSTGKGPAYAGWRQWSAAQAAGEPLEGGLASAILASNAHNTQPWLVSVDGDTLDVYMDLSRNIGSIDPFYREMYLSLGCFLENLHVTAAAHNHSWQETVYGGDFRQVHVARLQMQDHSLGLSSAHAALYEAIPERHTNRGAYDTARPMENQVLSELAALQDRDGPRLHWWTSAEDKQKVGDLIIQATEAIIADEQQARDSHRWYRESWDELQLRKDGTTLDATGNGFLVRAVGKLIPVSEQTAHDYWLGSTRDTQVPTAAAFGGISIPDPSDRRQLVAAGRLWQRIQLLATRMGIAMQPLNQPHERIDRDRQLGQPSAFGEGYSQLPGLSGQPCIFTFRAGYPDSPALPSPRRAVEEIRLARPV